MKPRPILTTDDGVGEPLATAEQAARFLNIGRSTLYRMAGRQIPVVRFGDVVRFRRADLRAFVERNTRQDASASRVERMLGR